MGGNFDVDRIDRIVPQLIRDAICDVVLAWGRYDGLVGQWVIEAFGMQLQAGAILIGNMDTRTKLERLKALYRLLEDERAVDMVNGFASRHKTFVEMRNAIAHAHCVGVLKDDPARALFAYVRPFGMGQMRLSGFHITEMNASAEFAAEASDKIFALLGKLRARRG